MFNLKEIIEHTKLKGYKEELQQMLYYAEDEFKEVEELTKTESFRRELIANVSHDLRTPLTLISGYGRSTEYIYILLKLIIVYQCIL